MSFRAATRHVVSLCAACLLPEQERALGPGLPMLRKAAVLRFAKRLRPVSAVGGSSVGSTGAMADAMSSQRGYTDTAVECESTRRIGVVVGFHGNSLARDDRTAQQEANEVAVWTLRSDSMTRYETTKSTWSWSSRCDQHHCSISSLSAKPPHGPSPNALSRLARIS